MPGTIGNSNHLKHGLTAGKLPSGCSAIAKSGKKLRTALEGATLASKGQVSVTSASSINVALRAEVTARLCQRWLNMNEGTMSHADRISYAKLFLSASESRDKAIRSLNLDAEPDAWATLQATFAEPVESEHVQPPDAVATLPSVPNVPSGQPQATT
jgi:hypothetical protein